MIEPRLFLDTCIMMALIRGGDYGAQVVERYDLHETSVVPYVSIVTHGELRVLAKRRSWGARKVAALTRALQTVVTVDINQEKVLKAYVDIDVHARESRPHGAEIMGKNDIWIAACAHAIGARLLTDDKGLFRCAEPHIEVDLVCDLIDT